MATVSFTQNLRQHIGSELASLVVDAPTVSAALAQVFGEHPKLRGYILDDQGAVRKHVAIFVDGNTIADRSGQSDLLSDDAEVFVTQALSGG